MSSRTRSLKPRSVASVLNEYCRNEDANAMTMPRSEARKRRQSRYDCVPEGIVANLLSHFAGTSRDIFQERLGGQVIDPEQDFPSPVSQRRILHEMKKKQ